MLMDIILLDNIYIYIYIYINGIIFFKYSRPSKMTIILQQHNTREIDKFVAEPHLLKIPFIFICLNIY